VSATARATAGDAAPVRVMICDDSAVIRGTIARALEADPDIRVVARVGNGRAAIQELARTRVDVLLLDIEMPVMDGMTALPLLLRTDPALRVIMASSLTTRGADIALRALRLGAADYLPKPSAIGSGGEPGFWEELLVKVKGLARLRRRVAALPLRPVPFRLQPAGILPPRLLAVGSSTGGPQALFTLVQGLGVGLPVPVVITQHMPRGFTAILAEHIDRLSKTPCAEARDGEPLQAGRIYVTPANQHLLIVRDGPALRAHLSDDAPENHCRPSVDPMLRTAASACDGRVLVAMLTGMGHDGLAGTRRVVEAGGTAIAQDEATSVVWGMPGSVAQAGLCHAVLPLPAIAGELRRLMGLASG
jgi:two-component system chemotaxis response regulator CheB